MPFDPDAYLKKSAPTSGGFDPDAYLGKKPAAAAPQAEPSIYDKVMDSALFAGPKVALGALEAGANMASGAIAKPVSDVMGTAAMGYDMLRGAPADDQRAEGFKRDVQDRMTYEPRTKAGQNIAEYNPLALLGKGVNWAGKQLEAPPTAGTGAQMVGAGLHEAVNQAPSFLGLKAPPVAAAAGKGLRGSAEGWMNSALKPGVSNPAAAKAAAGTMLDEGINVTKGGLQKANDKISVLNDQISDAIKNSPAVIDKRAVTMRLNGVLRDFEKQVNPTSDLVSIQKAWDDFMNHPLITGNKIPVAQAQEMKKGTYKSLGGKAYGELKGADMEAQKALARGLKEKIAQAVPEIKPLNAQESKMLQALPLLERRVLVEAGKNPMGLALLTTSPVKWAAFMADRSGPFKSLIAHMLNKASTAVPAAAVGAPAAGIATSQYAGQMQPPPPQGQ